MKLDFAILARNAELTGSGEAHIFGGGFNRVVLPKLPAPFAFAVAIRFSTRLSEDQDQHNFSVGVTLPNGQSNRVLSNRPITFSKNTDCPADPSWFVFVLNMAVSFALPGRHAITIFTGEDLIAELPFYVSIGDVGEQLEVMVE